MRRTLVDTILDALEPPETRLILSRAPCVRGLRVELRDADWAAVRLVSLLELERDRCPLGFLSLEIDRLSRELASARNPCAT